MYWVKHKLVGFKEYDHPGQTMHRNANEQGGQIVSFDDEGRHRSDDHQRRSKYIGVV
jgi:hypothetical protein